jgi:hypothetical protein
MGKLRTILDQIDSGVILLPEFQRGYVWNRDQVRGLMLSLYRGHPIGGLLFWETEAASVSVRGDIAGRGVSVLLLDGQQRVTTLYGLIRGRPPAFFEGDPSAVTGLHFNVEKEQFKFYSAAEMADDSRWVNVTKLFQGGPMAFVTTFTDFPDEANDYLQRLNTLWQVQERDLHEEGDGGWLSDHPTPGSALLPGEVGVHHPEADDVVVVTFGNGLRMSLRAARQLREEHGISARVLDLRWLAPLPFEEVRAHTTEVGRVVVADECRRSGGVADALVVDLVTNGSPARITTVRSEDSYVPLGPSAASVLLSEEQIVDAVLDVTST